MLFLEISFYKDIVKRNLLENQLESKYYALYVARKEVSEERIPQKSLLQSPDSKDSSQKPLALEFKSVTWSINSSDVRRAILRPGSSYEAVSSGSLSASSGSYGSSSRSGYDVDQGIG